MPDIGSIFDVDPRFFPLQGLVPSYYLRTILNLMFGLAGVLAFIFLLWGGLKWIVSGGDKDKVDAAKRTVLGALIGLGVVYSSYALLYIVRVLFGVNLIQFTLSRLGS